MANVVNQRQAGFTLIEVIMVMAIAGVLSLIVLNGFSSLRGQAEFSDAIDHLKETVVAQRTEALTTVKAGGGTDSSQQTIGRLLTFSPGSGTVRVDTLVTANTDAPVAGQAVTLAAGETTNVIIPWGIQYHGSTVAQVAFTRSAVDGSLQTTASQGTFGPPYHYGNFAPGGPIEEFMFQDSTGRTGYISIDQAANAVTRRFYQ